MSAISISFLFLLVTGLLCIGDSFTIVGGSKATSRSISMLKTKTGKFKFNNHRLVVVLKTAAESSSSSHDNNLQILLEQTFPVLSKIHGINWEGSCRYVNGELQHQSNLLLTGGVRYDLQQHVVVQEEDENNKTNDDDDDDLPTTNIIKCTLTSFLTFPNGKTRQVQMVGKKTLGKSSSSSNNNNLRLDPTSEDGPIYMVLTEIPPDTILLNEIDKFSGKIIMTSSISIPSTSSSDDDCDELIQISHEIGGGDEKGNTAVVEGHQIWRLTKRERRITGEYE